VEPRLIGDVRVRGFGFSASVGGRFREETKLLNVDLGNELTMGAGLRLPLYGEVLAALGEVYGALAIDGNMDTRSSPFEALGGLRVRVGDAEITAAAGAGLDNGFGTAQFRALGGVAYVPRPAGPRPLLASLPPAPPTRGAVDSDGDGVVDTLDRCPNQPGPKENDGCPDKDADGDGIVDRLDKCPHDVGPKENQGCPDQDADGDGIVDRLDKCPNDPETFNGFEDEDGCPDKGDVLAVLSDKEIELKQNIFFRTGLAVVEKPSHPVLAVVATLLKLHPEITKIRIEGHTDSSGKRERNVELSEERAAAVMHHLVLVHAVDPARMEARGYGPDRPIANNKTAKGRDLNRRVEFLIVDRKPEALPKPGPSSQNRGQNPGAP
jgi:outer membrane protein OmpA-like peptidoglycan-associated protein